MKKIIASLVFVLMFFAGQAQAAITCTTSISTAAKGNWFAGLFLKSHTYKIAFIQTGGAGTYNAATDQYSDVSAEEVTGTNYTAGGYTLDTLAYATSGTTYWMDFADEVSASTTFNQASTCAVIYDDSAVTTAYCTGNGVPAPCCTGTDTGTCQDAVLYVGTFASVQPNNGTLTVAFPTPDATNAIIKIALYDWLEQMMARSMSPCGPYGPGACFVEAQGVMANIAPSWHRDAIVKLEGASVNIKPGQF